MFWASFITLFTPHVLLIIILRTERTAYYIGAHKPYHVHKKMAR